jgi:hypothetical protein
MAKLEYEVTCPKCGRVEKGKRRAGADTRLEFICKGQINLIRGGTAPCGQRYTVTFFDEESAVEKSKDTWLRGEGDEFTDFKLRPR